MPHNPQDDEYIELRSVEENPLSVMAVMGSSYTCQEPRDAEMAAFLVTEGNTEVSRVINVRYKFCIIAQCSGETKTQDCCDENQMDEDN